MPVNVLKHHNSVVNDKTDGQNQGKQRERVDRKPGGVHQCASTDQTNRDGHERNHRSPQGAQKNQNYQGNKRNRLNNRPKDCLKGLIDKDGCIVGNPNVQTLRKTLLKLWQLLFECRSKHQWIGRGLFDKTHGHGWLRIECDVGSLIECANLHSCDLAQRYWVTVHNLDNDVAKLLFSLQIGLGRNRELALKTLNPSRRHFNILPAQGFFNIGGCELVRCESVGV